MKVVERKQCAMDTSFEQVFSESRARVPSKKVLETLPQRLLDNATVHALGLRNRERIQRRSYVLISRMRNWTSPEILIRIELFVVRSVASKDFQRDVLRLAIPSKITVTWRTQGRLTSDREQARLSRWNQSQVYRLLGTWKRKLLRC